MFPALAFGLVLQEPTTFTDYIFSVLIADIFYTLLRMKKVTAWHSSADMFPACFFSHTVHSEIARNILDEVQACMFLFFIWRGTILSCIQHRPGAGDKQGGKPHTHSLFYDTFTAETRK